MHMASLICSNQVGQSKLGKWWTATYTYFELVGSHQRCVCTSCSGHTGFMYPEASSVIMYAWHEN